MKKMCNSSNSSKILNSNRFDIHNKKIYFHKILQFCTGQGNNYSIDLSQNISNSSNKTKLLKKTNFNISNSTNQNHNPIQKLSENKNNFKEIISFKNRIEKINDLLKHDSNMEYLSNNYGFLKFMITEEILTEVFKYKFKFLYIQ